VQVRQFSPTRRGEHAGLTSWSLARVHLWAAWPIGRLRLRPTGLPRRV